MEEIYRGHFGIFTTLVVGNVSIGLNKEKGTLKSKRELNICPA